MNVPDGRKYKSRSSHHYKSIFKGSSGDCNQFLF
jgi:hypothetical protein